MRFWRCRRAFSPSSCRTGVRGAQGGSAGLVKHCQRATSTTRHPVSLPATRRNVATAAALTSSTSCCSTAHCCPSSFCRARCRSLNRCCDSRFLSRDRASLVATDWDCESRREVPAPGCCCCCGGGAVAAAVLPSPPVPHLLCCCGCGCCCCRCSCGCSCCCAGPTPARCATGLCGWRS